MIDFNKYLEQNETILYKGKPHPNKGGKNIVGIIILLGFVLLCQILLILSVIFNHGSEIKFIISFLITLLFGGLGVYALIYNLFLKKRKVADDFYCITNKRALKYEAGKDKLVYGYLINYSDIHCGNVKDGYGDLYMSITKETTNDSIKDLNDLKNTLFNPNPENMPAINFESIENPKEVLQIAVKARNNLNQN